MKKFKLFALAVFAMLSTNAFATPGDYDANTVFRFKIITDYVAASSTLGTAQITGFVADYTDVATTKIPATINGASLGGKYKVVSIADNAFKGKAITKIDLSAAENLTEIGAGALSGTGITSLDLSATKVAVLNQLFETTNKKVKSVKLPKTLTTIGANAFNGLSALTKITFAEQTAPATYGLTIEGFAFKNTMALTTLTLPANVSYIAANAFAKTYLTTLTISGTIKAYAAAVLYADAAEYNAAKGTTLDAGAFAALSDAEKTKTPATGVADGAFVKNGTQTLTVTYKPAKVGGVYVNPFKTTTGKSICFSESEAAADVYVTLSTSTEYGNFIKGEITKFCGVKVDFTPAENAKITVYNHGGTYSYGKFTAPAGGITIAKKQGDANVMVYGAYTDDTNPVAVLMEQMHLIQGSYYLPEGTKFIVKSSSDAKVEYTAGVKLNGTGANQDSRNYSALGAADRNEIKEYAGADDYAVAVTPVTPGKDYIIFLKPLDETAFGWAEFTDNRVIKEGQFYLEAKAPAAAAGIRVIWLDGSEEDQVTAIKTVKGAKAENGAIFNLAGQKVNAAYKGVVIKDGKKYIQK